MKILDISRFVTTDTAPPIGDIGKIIHVNTMNGEPESVAVMFEHRSWVFPVDHLRHE